MTHTAELFTEITAEEYKKILQHPFGQWRRHKQHGFPVFHIGILEDYGITDIKLHKIQTPLDFNIYYCFIIVNLQRLVDQRRSIKTYTLERDFSMLQTNFEKHITDLIPSHKDINSWTVKRIDYNIDLKMTQKEVEQYITLLQRGGKHYSWNVHTLKGQSQAKHPRGSVLFDNKQYSINIYDKHLERLCSQEKRGINNSEELEESKGILRIEVQAKNKKIKNIKQCFDCNFEGRPLEYFARFDIAEPIITKALEQICGEADYFSYNEAVEWVRERLGRKDTVKAIEDFLTLVSRFRSLWKAKKEYLKSKRKISLQTVLKNLSNLNINPVTIPKSFKVNYMENLLNRTRVELAELKEISLSTP